MRQLIMRNIVIPYAVSFVFLGGLYFFVVENYVSRYVYLVFCFLSIGTHLLECRYRKIASVKNNLSRRNYRQFFWAIIVAVLALVVWIYMPESLLFYGPYCVFIMALAITESFFELIENKHLRVSYSETFGKVSLLFLLFPASTKVLDLFVGQ